MSKHGSLSAILEAAGYLSTRLTSHSGGCWLRVALLTPVVQDRYDQTKFYQTLSSIHCLTTCSKCISLVINNKMTKIQQS